LHDLAAVLAADRLIQPVGRDAQEVLAFGASGLDDLGHVPQPQNVAASLQHAESPRKFEKCRHLLV
jgi:hypothetical protein